MATSIPFIDPNVEHVGVSRLRKLNASNLRKFEKTLVIQDNDTPLAVLLTYKQFLAMQTQLQSVVQTIELLSDEEEVRALGKGTEDAKSGRTKSIEEIRASMKRSE
ncbi:MAG: hypothetical protein ABSH47_05970 [Bryobacteraceae bacterium]